MNPLEIPPSQPPQPAPEDSQKKETPLTPEQLALVQMYQDEIAREAAIPKVGGEECEQKVTELDDLLRAFEATHPIQELYAVTELDGKDAALHPEKYLVRTTAKRDLIPIAAALKFLKERTTLPSERYEELQARYRYFSRAVGVINNGKVDHAR